ncbi:MAG: gluconokinase [Chloroflexi bacterium]|nr:gluconokinase [Chloroflexota bacterium]
MDQIPPDQAELPFVLALDVGTSSTRAMLFDRQSRALEGVTARREYTFTTRPDGTEETDPDRLMEQIWECIDELMAKAKPSTHGIVGVAVDTFVANVMAIDEAGKPITSLISYADTRPTPEAAELRQRFDEEAVHQRTGVYFHPSYVPARFLWFAKHQPAVHQNARRWISLGEYLELRLFGEVSISYSAASWTGLLNRTSLDWDEELLATLPVEKSQLSPLVDFKDFKQGLQQEYAERWPALAQAPWFPAVGDGAASNVGSGCTSPGQTAVVMGTSSAVRVILEQAPAVIPHGLWSYRVDRRRSLLGGALSEGGSVFAWLTHLLNLEGNVDADQAAGQAPPGANGLVFLPLISGERSPGWAGSARGAVTGLSLATTPAELLRSGMEGVACRIAIVYDLVRQVLPSDPQIIASGGALLHSPVWLQILADVLGKPVTASLAEEASARGAALLAFEALGYLGDVSQAPQFTGQVYLPDPARHALYKDLIEQQKTLYDQVIRG